MRAEDIFQVLCARDALTVQPPSFQFSVGSLVTNTGQYERMLRSFQRFGFDSQHAEFMYVDNRNGNQFDAYGGLNLLLARARGQYVILCHQDVELIGDGRRELQERLTELANIDPNWGLAGNAGGARIGVLPRRISDPHGSDQFIGELPAEVESLDENSIVVRRDAMLGFSRDLRGFHLYGTDLCQQARLRGWTSWVINFHLLHHSAGVAGQTYFDCLSAFEEKYSKRRLGNEHRVQTSCATALVSGSRLHLALRRFSRSSAGLALNAFVESVSRKCRRLPNRIGKILKPGTDRGND